MTFTKHLFLCAALVSLSACQTTSNPNLASDVLLSDIDTSKISSTSGASLLSANNPTCVKFYENTGAFMTMPAADLSTATGPSFGGQLLKTVVLGTLSGIASGGVASLGISNGFAEAALAGTANQVTFQAGSTVYDKIVKTDVPDPALPTAAALTPMQEIQKAANQIGCPAPDAASIAALNLGAN